MKDYVQLADESTDVGDFEEAKRYLQMAIDAGPQHYRLSFVTGDNTTGLVKLALALGKAKRWQEAVCCLAKAERLLPGDLLIRDFGWLYLMWDAAEAGEVELAFRCFERVKELKPTAPRSWLSGSLRELALEDWAMEQGKLDEATRLLERVLAFDPEDEENICMGYLWCAAEAAKRELWDAVYQYVLRARDIGTSDRGDFAAYLRLIASIATRQGKSELASWLVGRAASL